MGGLVNDIVVGTVNPQQATVTVNGVAAQVSNRSFSVGGAAGAGPEHDSGAGNGPVGQQRDDVGRGDAGAGQRVGGAGVGQQADGPGGHGAAAAAGGAADERSRSAGGQRAGGVPGGGEQRRAGERQRDAGVAGGHDERAGAGVGDVPARDASGVGNNVVEATATGFAGAAVFTHSGTATAAQRIVVDTGNGQMGVVGQALALPFVGDRDRRGLQSPRRRAGDASR